MPFKIETAAGAFPALGSADNPGAVVGEPSMLSVDTFGRLRVVTSRLVPQVGPTFVIPNGTSDSNTFVPTAPITMFNFWNAYDDAARLAAEVITIQIASTLTPAAGDWRQLITLFTATLNAVGAIPGNAIAGVIMRLHSAVPVGGTRTFVSTYS